LITSENPFGHCRPDLEVGPAFSFQKRKTSGKTNTETVSGRSGRNDFAMRLPEKERRRPCRGDGEK
jgi:hypothetical protein